MTIAPSNNGCPSWVDEVPTGLEDRDAFNRDRAQRLVTEDARVTISPGHLLRWHEALFAGIVPLAYYAGNFRQVNGDMPCLAQFVAVADVQGSSPDVCIDHVAKLFANCLPAVRVAVAKRPAQSPENTRLLATTIAYFVGEFIRIHPFLNGNGRTSRLLWMWLLLRFGLRPQVRIAPRPSEPYSTVMAAVMRGDDAHLALYILLYLAQGSR